RDTTSTCRGDAVAPPTAKRRCSVGTNMLSSSENNGEFAEGELIMDIGSGHGYPAAALSNFSPHAFVFRGIPVASMEGLLQSFKEKTPDMQKHVMTLVGRAAKFKGKKKKWWRTQTLFWQGTPIDRHSDEYQALLDEAYTAMFTQNESARRALLATQNAVLTHS